MAGREAERARHRWLGTQSVRSTASCRMGAAWNRRRPSNFSQEGGCGLSLTLIPVRAGRDGTFSSIRERRAIEDHRGLVSHGVTAVGPVDIDVGLRYTPPLSAGLAAPPAGAAPTRSGRRRKRARAGPQRSGKAESRRRSGSQSGERDGASLWCFATRGYRIGLL